MGLFDKLAKKEVNEFSEYEAMVLAGLSILNCDIEEMDGYSEIYTEIKDYIDKRNKNRETLDWVLQVAMRDDDMKANDMNKSKTEKDSLNYLIIFVLLKPLELLSWLKIVLQNESIYQQLLSSKDIYSVGSWNKFGELKYLVRDCIDKLNLDQRFKRLLDIVSSEDIDEVIEIVAESISDIEVKKTLLVHLVDLAMADGGLSSSEEILLKQYVEALEVDSDFIEKTVDVISYKSIFMKV